MKKNLGWLLLLAAPVVFAQQTAVLDGQALQEAFEKYNPQALEKAAQDPFYHKIFTQLTSQYTAEKNDANEMELIALVKNFDNSVDLHLLGQYYKQQMDLQAATGTPLPALQEQVTQAVQERLQNAYDNTLFVKKIQIARYKEQIKQVRKNELLTADEKKAQINALKQQIKQVKEDVRSLKKNAKQKIKESAEAYVMQLKADYEAALDQAAQAAQSASHDVKANHKKPVAK